MKRLATLALTAILSLLIAASCSPTSFSAKFRIFVNEVEARCPKYTAEDWEKANETYDRLMDEFKKKRLTMSRSEVQEVKDNMVRFQELEANTPVQTEREPEVEVNVKEVEDFLKGNR